MSQLTSVQWRAAPFAKIQKIELVREMASWVLTSRVSVPMRLALVSSPKRMVQASSGLKKAWRPKQVAAPGRAFGLGELDQEQASCL
jgi:hypothetical protein